MGHAIRFPRYLACVQFDGLDKIVDAVLSRGVGGSSAVVVAVLEQVPEVELSIGRSELGRSVEVERDNICSTLTWCVGVE
jgi:galactokinase/mevalonate kinase-like predicted kinase